MHCKTEIIGYEPPVIILTELALELSFLTGSVGSAGTEDLEDGGNASVTWGYN
jgi:hypothetical protein